MKNFKVIVTVGPAMLNEDKLIKIDSCGQCVYRINGAHADEEKAARMIEQIRDILPKAKIMMDLPGNKIRTANLAEPISLVRGESFVLHDYEVNYPKFYRHLNKRGIIYANDSIYTLEVLDITGSSVKLLSHSDGLLLSNKGLHVRGIHEDIPFLFEKDYKLIDTACSFGVDYLSLSFVRTANDVCEVKKLIKQKNIHILAKIETLSAVEKINDILKEVESVIVDRGDLSTEIGMLKLAVTQEKIIQAALTSKRQVFLATQFLKNMEKNPVPLIAEVIDLCKTVKSGITGIQLSEETAVGRYPVECVRLVFDAVNN